MSSPGVVEMVDTFFERFGQRLAKRELIPAIGPAEYGRRSRARDGDNEGHRMSTLHDPDPELERRLADRLLDVLIRAGVLLALAVLCFQVFSPFLSLMIWALILAVTLYPLHQSVAAKIGGRQGLAATLLVLLGVVVVVVPTAALMSSLGDSLQRLIHDVQNNTLQVPPPRESVAGWPLVGEKVHAFWTRAHTDLPALVQSMQPKIGNLARGALGVVAGGGRNG